MATVADILTYIETIAPPYMKEEWDNVGLLCGRRDQEVRKVLVALDPFLNVIQEAVEMGAGLIVTHHPLIFRNDLKAINEKDTERVAPVNVPVSDDGEIVLKKHSWNMLRFKY